MLINKAIGLFLLLFACFSIRSNAQSNSYITVKNHKFFIGHQTQYFIGTNYWYGGLLTLQKNKDGLSRIKKELDFLKAKGVTNLRLLAGAEGTGKVAGVTRVGPPFQKSKKNFDVDYLKGLDFLLEEMSKRNMKAVIFLSNNWEWSGGFLQYLNWNDKIPDSIFRNKLTWDQTKDFVSQFYSCNECMEDYIEQVKFILEHTNSINNKKYTDDPTIMSWEIANEPRPMLPAAITAYKKWIAAVALFIKNKDKNHLLTIGTEGYIGTDNIDAYKEIHADNNIDYLTIHIWPKNWNWFTGNDISNQLDSVIMKTNDYISKHVGVAVALNKPLVIEEFGLPRDDHSFNLSSSTIARDRYYSSIFQLLRNSKNKNEVIGGVNFWTYGGSIVPQHLHWQEGDDYIGDPPMEEQGLNAVFDNDVSTWKLVNEFSKNLK